MVQTRCPCLLGPASRPQQDIANRQRTTLEVDLDDLEGYSKEPELVEHLERNTQQYLTLLAEAADNIMPPPSEHDLPEDVFDVLLDQVGPGRGHSSRLAARGAMLIGRGGQWAGRAGGRHARLLACRMQHAV